MTEVMENHVLSPRPYMPESCLISTYNNLHVEFSDRCKECALTHKVIYHTILQT